MSDAAPTVLAYGHSPVKRRRRMIVIVLLVLTTIGAVIWWKSPAIRWWWQRFVAYRTVMNAPSVTDELTISQPEDALATTTGEILTPKSRQLRAWMTPLAGAQFELWRVRSGTPASTGDPGLAFLGMLCTPSGQERLAALGCNVMTTYDLKMVIVTFHVELHDPGSYRSLTVHTLPVKQAPTTQPYPGDLYPDRHWITFNPLRFKTGTPVLLGVPAVAAGDPATLRVPLTIEGQPDALLFTLLDGNAITLRSESGTKLPYKIDLPP